MIFHPQNKTPPTFTPATAAGDVERLQQANDLLRQAAEAAAHSGMAPDAFATAAWHAYMMAAPELAERLAEMQFEAALEELRKSGRLAKA